MNIVFEDGNPSSPLHDSRRILSAPHFWPTVERLGLHAQVSGSRPVPCLSSILFFSGVCFLQLYGTLFAMASIYSDTEAHLICSNTQKHSLLQEERYMDGWVGGGWWFGAR